MHKEISSSQRRALFALATIGLLASGCATPEPIPTVREVNVDACAKGDVTSQLVMVDELAGYFKEMPSCGALANSFAFNVAELLVSVAVGREHHPSGLTYQGSGYYAAGTLMSLQAKLARDTSFGKAGDDVPFDVYDLSEYFESIELSADVELGVSLDTNGGTDAHAKGNLTLGAVTNPGPALELFGIDPSNIGASFNVEALAEAIGSSVELTQQISQGSIVNGEGIVVKLSVPSMKVFDMYSGAPINYQVLDVHAEKAPQTANLVTWDIDYRSGHGDGYLDGTIVMKVEGDFTYYVRYEYPKQVEANVFVTCDAPM
jgi:hypothetical protein